jgi:hypothetical protein
LLNVVCDPALGVWLPQFITGVRFLGHFSFASNLISGEKTTLFEIQVILVSWFFLTDKTFYLKSPS